ncbi:MBL fold metallo-hydrolase [Desulfurella sp.]|uniref:MBL fold metallo-hydrolase n=1 Tax=Desulfurella sp. TaxID=1962857 RepID=UPI0025C215B5|nr:MBL fold metallo-hydrolase [Desulfurella sp.]
MGNNTLLFSNGIHQNILLEDFGRGQMVQANVHLIVDNKKSIILDPGGHKVFKHVLTEIGAISGIGNIEYIFLSHQDPDIVSAINGWLMTLPKTKALISNLWIRFLPHIGVDSLFVNKLIGIDDKGAKIKLTENCELYILPAHFLHSPGNFQIYDPISKILYSGDLGASLGQDYIYVDNFENHTQYMIGFHKRYMSSKIAIQKWINMAKQLDIDLIAPQHGAFIKGKENIEKFYAWLENLELDIDNMHYEIPQDFLNV